MRYIEWNKISNCTEEERKGLLPYIDQLAELKWEYEKKGIAAFDDFCNQREDPFEKTSVKLIAQGYMPEVCENVLYNILNSSDYKAREYLKNLIFTEFILAVQKKPIGDMELRLLLISCLGIELSDSFIFHVDNAVGKE